MRSIKTLLGSSLLALSLLSHPASATEKAAPIHFGDITWESGSLITEILRQRRYSLFGEGHRWVDLRRYNRLNELPIDRPDDDVWTKFPRPANED